MLLKTLEMQGFKSFPDKTVLSFGRGITAVVGPNGSGKSNISDAVRWVLGETSTKSLRGSKMEDVIFGGTQQRKAQGFAQVVLTLDNTDRTLADYGDTVSVSRRYYRSGESEYKIDGQTVRRRDVRELFMDTGLGADGYSSVGQGRIASIIEAKGDERRELFDEAAGISRFRHKKADAQRRLEQAQENLVRLLDILSELEQRVGPLKKQSEKAAEFLKYAEEKKELEIGLWMKKISAFTSDLRELEHKIDAATVSFETCEKELESIENSITQTSDEIAKVNVDIETAREKISSFESDRLKKQSDISVAKAQLDHNADTIRRLTADMQASGGDKSAAEAQIAEKEQQIAAWEKEIGEKKEALAALSRSMEDALSQGEAKSAESEKISREISELTMQLSQCEITRSAAQSSADAALQRVQNVEKSMAEAQADMEKTKKVRSEHAANVQYLQERCDSLQNALAGYRMRLSARQKQADEAAQTLENASRALSAAQSKVRMLTDLEKNMEGYSGAVKAVVRHSRAGALQGIHGTLAGLITVEDAYSTAIEVALGAAMQNVVTDSEADAKRAIYYLKQNRLGRATFLPLSAIQSRALRENGLSSCSGFVAVADELVQTAPQYKQVVSYLLGRCVVAEDMDSAIAIARAYNNRFKIVTLDGQVMNPGGSMTGGSQAKGAGILSRANAIESEKQNVQTLTEKVHTLEASAKSATEALHAANAEVQGAEAELRTASEDLIRAQGDLKLVDGRLSAAEASCRSLQAEKEENSGKTASLQEKIDALEAQAQQLRDRIEALEKTLQALSTDRLGFSQSREKLRAEAEEVQLAIIALTKDQESARSLCEQMRARIAQHDSRVQSVAAEIEAVKRDSASVQQKIAAMEGEITSFSQAAKAADEQVRALLETRNGLDKKAAELRIFEKNKNEEHASVNAELVRLDERKISMRKEYEDLKTKLYEEYELTPREAAESAAEIADVPAANRRLQALRSSIKALGSVNVGAIEEYKEVSERYTFLKDQLNDVEQSKSELTKIIEDLTASMSTQFMDSFQKINEQFKVCFTDFFGGGRGELVLENPADCLETPIEIRIQPPGKSVQNLNLFSGGEKSLAALALLFALLKVNPAPFCIYDEVEAALDDVNVERFAKYMRKMTDKTQFIAITHRRGTMEEADVLYGVTMQEKGVSKLLELQSAELAAKMKLDQE